MLEKNIKLSNDLHEMTKQGSSEFPIQYYMDDFSRMSENAVPLHWHQQLELFMVFEGEMEVQVLQEKIILEKGQAILVNPNILHGYRQSHSGIRSLCPNIVFSSDLISGRIEAVSTKYIQPLTMNIDLPCIIIHGENEWQKEILLYLDRLFSLLQKYCQPNEISHWPMLPFANKEISSPCYEMAVQNVLNRIWQIIFAHREEIPQTISGSHDLTSLVRMQKMLSFIEKHYQEHLTLEDIAASADIGRSEAARCFNKYMDASPVEYLISHRIREAQEYLRRTVLTIEEISEKCGFSSAGYFTRVFKNATAQTPSEYRQRQRSDSSDQGHKRQNQLAGKPEVPL